MIFEDLKADRIEVPVCVVKGFKKPSGFKKGSRETSENIHVEGVDTRLRERFWRRSPPYVD